MVQEEKAFMEECREAFVEELNKANEEQDAEENADHKKQAEDDTNENVWVKKDEILDDLESYAKSIEFVKKRSLSKGEKAMFLGFKSIIEDASSVEIAINERDWLYGYMAREARESGFDDDPKFFKYGMRLRGFSIGCQPMDGLVEHHDDATGKYHDILVYDRTLSAQEMIDYELDFLESW